MITKSMLLNYVYYDWQSTIEVGASNNGFFNVNNQVKL